MEDTVMRMERLCDCILEGDAEKALVEAERLLAEGTPPEALVESLAAEMETLGERFQNYDAFLPDLILAGDVFTQVLNHLEKRLPAPPPGQEGARPYVAVVGTVQEDTHDMGKNLLVIALRLGGFRVVDLGTDVSPEDFLTAVERHQADVVGLSTLLSSTLVFQEEFVRLLSASGRREDVLIAIGGAATSRQWSEEIGADVWNVDAFQSVREIRRELEARQQKGKTWLLRRKEPCP
jgi:methylmalonyl-CoA mutase cobalamin-binding domain/chain